MFDLIFSGQKGFTNFSKFISNFSAYDSSSNFNKNNYQKNKSNYLKTHYSTQKNIYLANKSNNKPLFTTFKDTKNKKYNSINTDINSSNNDNEEYFIEQKADAKCTCLLF